MPILPSAIVKVGDAFRANCAAHLALIQEFRALEAKVRETSNRAEKKFRSRGQLLPRERVSFVLDRDMPYVEISTLCGLGMNEDDGTDNVYGGGSIAGI